MTLKIKAMDPQRRNLLKLGLGSLIPLPAMNALDVEKELFDDKVDILDYGRSFICNNSSFNSVRMWIESRTIIFDSRAGSKIEFYQGASCKSEDTFASSDLFYEDNYDFLPVFGDGKVLVFRRHSNVREDMEYRAVKKMEDMWGADPDLILVKPKKVAELDTWEKISSATKAGSPIILQTEISNEALGLRAIIECPCKTLNISPKEMGMFQTDTGPVAMPDLSKRYDNLIECLGLAFVAFNTFDFADFIKEVPTDIFRNGRKTDMVYHFSERSSLKSKNTIFSIM